MPGKTQRGTTLDDLYHMRKKIIMGDSDSDIVDEAMDENMALTCTIQSRRYFQRPETYRNKGINADARFQTWILEGGNRFYVFTHMQQSSFLFIFDLIRDNAVFATSAASPAVQRAVFFQLFVALTKISGGGEGNGIDKVCETFNIGHGTVALYVRRCITAINSHSSTFVVWPNKTRRAELSAYADRKFGFPGFIASCDGTLIGLRRAPVFSQYPETYSHARHKKYGFNVLFWVDHFGNILRFTCNWPGSASDQTIFNASSFAQNPWDYLVQNEEYIFVDLGFKKELFAVPPYKGADGKLLHNAKFNKAQRRGRTKVEHVNGIIKGRFSTLTALPIEIKSDDDHEKCSDWITCCVILHNILTNLGDEFEFEVPVDEHVDEGFNERNPTAKQFQDAVRDRWLVAHGGYEQ
jgi:hypothetical protein